MKELLKELSQEHLLEKKELYSQILSYDPKLLRKQKEHYCPAILEPCKEVSSWNEEDRKLGEAFLKKGKTAVLLLAGGQGSRLGKGTKGKICIGDKPLFELFCEHLVRAEERYGIKIPLAVMTSSSNKEETEAYFASKKNFGLEVFFFEERKLPLLDEAGKWFLQDGKIAEGPAGNGVAFLDFFESGLFSLFEKKGIELLSVCPGDNPLLDPLTPGFIGFHKKEVTVLAIKREGRKLGALGLERGRLKMIEYSDLPHEANYPFGYSGFFLIDLSLVKKAAYLTRELPLHRVWKEFAPLKKAIKCEAFIFDLFPFFTVKPCLLTEELFCPVKDEESLKALLRIFEKRRTMQI